MKHIFPENGPAKSTLKVHLAISRDAGEQLEQLVWLDMLSKTSRVLQQLYPDCSNKSSFEPLLSFK